MTNSEISVLCMNYFLLFSGDAFTCYISFCCILIARALLLLKEATFSDLRKRKNGSHGLKAVEEKPPQKITFTTAFPIKKDVINPYTWQPCSFSKDKRQYACFSHRYSTNPTPCVQLHDLSEKPRDTQCSL